MNKIKSILAGAVFAIMALTSPTLFAYYGYGYGYGYDGNCGCPCPSQCPTCPQGCGCPEQQCPQCKQLPCGQQCCGIQNNSPTCNWTPVIAPQCYGPCQQQPAQRQPMMQQPMQQPMMQQPMQQPMMQQPMQQPMMQQPAQQPMQQYQQRYEYQRSDSSSKNTYTPYTYSYQTPYQTQPETLRNMPRNQH